MVGTVGFEGAENVENNAKGRKIARPCFRNGRKNKREYRGQKYGAKGTRWADFGGGRTLEMGEGLGGGGGLGGEVEGLGKEK